MGKCKNIRVSWLNEFKWFSENKVKNAKEVGFCNICNKSINVERGKQVLTQHQDSASHKSMVKMKASGQMRFEIQSKSQKVS